MDGSKTRTVLAVLTDKFVYFEVGAFYQPRMPSCPANWSCTPKDDRPGVFEAEAPCIISIGLCPTDSGDVPAWASINLSDGKAIIAYHIHDVTFGPEREIEGWDEATQEGEEDE